MKFRSPTETPIHIALLSGHTCVIGPQLAEVEPRFHREAVAAGAIPEGMDAAAPVAAPEKSKSQLIVDAVKAAIDDAKADEFDGQGKVKIEALSKRAGFNVSASERNAAWTKVEQELA